MSDSELENSDFEEDQIEQDLEQSQVIRRIVLRPARLINHQKNSPTNFYNKIRSLLTILSSKVSLSLEAQDIKKL